MKIKRLQIIIFTLIITLLLFTTGSLAGSLKDEMRTRQPKINKLKADGLIGENNRGHLEYRGDKEPRKGLVEAENQDRDAVYGAIARQQSTDSNNVGRRRAAQIADRAPTGTWLQDNNGEWYKK